MNKKLKEGDRVSCVFNSTIEGEITKRACYHGLYLYSVKIDDEESFVNFFGLASVNVVWLHYQLRKQ